MSVTTTDVVSVAVGVTHLVGVGDDTRTSFF
jgi:hypothetical protein